MCIFRFDSPLLFTNVERFKSDIYKAFDEWNKAQSVQDSSNSQADKEIESGIFTISTKQNDTLMV